MPEKQIVFSLILTQITIIGSHGSMVKTILILQDVKTYVSNVACCFRFFDYNAPATLIHYPKQYHERLFRLPTKLC